MLRLITRDSLLNPQYFNKIAPRVLYEILKLLNIHRADSHGRFSRFTDVVRGVPQTVYCTDKSQLSPFPTHLAIEVASAPTVSNRSSDPSNQPSHSESRGAIVHSEREPTFLSPATVLFLAIIAIPVALLARDALIFRHH